MKNGLNTMENSLAVLQKVNVELQYDPAILILAFNQLSTESTKELKTGI